MRISIILIIITICLMLLAQLFILNKNLIPIPEKIEMGRECNNICNGNGFSYSSYLGKDKENKIYCECYSDSIVFVEENKK